MNHANVYSNTLLRRMRLALTVMAAAIVLFSVTNHIQAAQNTVELSVMEGGRNVGMAVDELQKRYGYIITYEDPVRVYADDLADFAERDRKDFYKYPPGKAPKLIAANDPSLTLNIPASPTITTQQMAAVLNQLIQAQAATGRGAHFRVQQISDLFHVIPTEVRDRNGNWVPQTPILDTVISLPTKNRSETEMIGDICNAVNAVSPVRINRGIGLRNGLGLHSVNEDGSSTTVVPPLYQFGANSEKARDVLTRALALLADRRMSWYVYFDNMDHMYYLSFEEISVPKN